MARIPVVIFSTLICVIYYPFPFKTCAMGVWCLIGVCVCVCGCNGDVNGFSCPGYLGVNFLRAIKINASVKIMKISLIYHSHGKVRLRFVMVIDFILFRICFILHAQSNFVVRNEKNHTNTSFCMHWNEMKSLVSFHDYCRCDGVKKFFELFIFFTFVLPAKSEYWIAQYSLIDTDNSIIVIMAWRASTPKKKTNAMEPNGSKRFYCLFAFDKNFTVVCSFLFPLHFNDTYDQSPSTQFLVVAIYKFVFFTLFSLCIYLFTFYWPIDNHFLTARNVCLFASWQICTFFGNIRAINWRLKNWIDININRRSNLSQ